MIIGKVLDEKYEIIELIGQGGMAMVYKAKDKRLDRYVAVKVLKNEFIDNEQFLKKFIREAQSDAKLAHPNIVNVYDVGVENNYYYIVMEYIDGKTLKNLIKSSKKLSPEETVSLILPVAAGLNHAHKNNIIHRDIKPHNILLTSSKLPKVADFGIARAINSSTVTATEEALGSVHYISPEQARGGFLDERSDLYSLGIMMYEMLTGELPFDGETPVAVALKHVQNNVPSPKDRQKNIPDGVNQIVLNLTRRKPDDRYQNTDELIADLKKVAANINADIAPTYSSLEYGGALTVKDEKGGIIKSPAETRKKTKKRNNTLLFTVIGIVVLSVMAYSVYMGNWGKKIEVPFIEGMTIDQASQELAKVGLKYEIIDRINSVEIAKDVIISQLPDAGERIKASEPVQLKVSLGPKFIVVPDVINQSKDEAENTLKNAGFVYVTTVYEFKDDIEKDKVFEQNPASGFEIAENSTITIKISKGKDTVPVPYLVKLTLEEAEAALLESGLTIGNKSFAPSNTYAKGLVISQTPNAYDEVDKGTKIDLVISLGKPISKTISIDLKNYTSGISNQNVEVRVDLVDNGNATTVYTQTVNKDQTINVTMEGLGDKIYKLYINGDVKYTGAINFS